MWDLAGHQYGQEAAAWRSLDPGKLLLDCFFDTLPCALCWQLWGRRLGMPLCILADAAQRKEWLQLRGVTAAALAVKLSCGLAAQSS